MLHIAFPEESVFVNGHLNLKKLNRFKSSTKIYATILNVKETTMQDIYKNLSVPIASDESMLLWYYQQNGMKQSWEIIHSSFLDEPTIWYLYKLISWVQFGTDIVIQCAKFYKGDEMTDQIFLHFSMNNNITQIEHKKTFFLQNEIQTALGKSPFLSCIRTLLTPAFEKNFDFHSFVFRDGQQQRQAV